ncbi:DUF6712 family protein [Prevotellamassilia timonensis]|uniref:DUF6712 family protein n=1 Tax=Prevotellamassilia timonensis TaxID=1852370 RepID=UPI0008D99901|nr:DUF6712 family protein [Prevotellamassilia timonensis]
MSLLIPDNNVLLQFVPNVLKSVQGETLLFDKIAPHLEVAEAWLTTTFLSEAVLAKLPTRNANNKLLHYGRTRQTLWRAVQMLTQKLSCQTIHDCPKVVPLHYESEWQ